MYQGALGAAARDPRTFNAHLFNVVPYIARNPSEFSTHPWSSYPGSVGARAPFTFVDDEFLLTAYGSLDRLRTAVEAWAPTSADLRTLGLRYRA
jgi:hypothetical protein